MKNEKFYSHITEGEFGTLLPGQFLIVIGQDDDWKWRSWGDFSKIYFFLLAITDSLEEIDQYLNNVLISLLDISQEQLNIWSGTRYDPFKLGLFGLEENTMSDAAVKCLKHINYISKSNIVPNVNGVLSRREIDEPVDLTIQYYVCTRFFVDVNDLGATIDQEFITYEDICHLPISTLIDQVKQIILF